MCFRGSRQKSLGEQSHLGYLYKPLMKCHRGDTSQEKAYE